MTEQEKFKRAIEKIKTFASEYENVLAKDDIKEELSELKLTDKQLELVYEYLQSAKITVADYQNEKVQQSLNHEDSAYLKMYLEDLSALEKINQEEKQKLIGLAVNGDRAAVKKLPEAYFESVVGLARTYTNQGVLLEDLIQEGNIGLLSAASCLSHCSTLEEAEAYIIQEITGAMENAVYESDAVLKEETEFIEKAGEVHRVINELTNELGRVPSAEEIAEKSAVEAEEIMDVLKLIKN